jgi:transcriptional regulator NrdR family protein
MKCPSCDNAKSIVTDSRPREDDFAAIRRRKCSRCDFVYHTVEIFYNKPVKQKAVKPKVDVKKAKKAQMNKRLTRLKRREAARRIDEMTDEELEEAMFSGADLKDLGIN